ncbi:MAG: twin-arginine translocase subunit TatC [Acidobacteriota bacterium]|nr:twin-arginine translocase subunit TatC [Acidobacteriota bacterium]
MTLLEHLDELRKRLFKAVLAYLIALGACWVVSERLVGFIVQPIRDHLFEGSDIVFIHVSEAFMIYMKSAALTAIFVAAPLIFYQLWAFIAPALYKNERRWVFPFLLFSTLFFVGGGAFGYYVATPIAASWLLNLGSEFTAQITLRSAFSFQSTLILGMGAVFEMPILIFFLARIGVVTPAFLMRNFRYAVLVIALLSAVITPTGDMMTMAVFAVPMILLYLLGVGVAAISGRSRR